MGIPKKNVRVDLSTDSDGEHVVDLFRKYGEIKPKQVDIAPAYLNELEERRLNVITNIKNIRLLSDFVLMFSGLTLAGTGVLGYGIGDLNFKIMIAGGAGGFLSYLAMIITQYRIDKIRDKIAVQRKRSNIYTRARAAKKDTGKKDSILVSSKIN